MSHNLYTRLIEAILENEPEQKCALTVRLQMDWQKGLLDRLDDAEIEKIDIPGRPSELELVDPRHVPRRSLATEQGRMVMLHSFAHIEFNAINLALDAAYRFRDMPFEFVSDWLKVASEEASHFTLIDNYLNDLGVKYGDFKAHNGLWDMVCKTRHDVLHRMALVPRVMEARGLDVTPSMMDKFKHMGDERSVQILQTIYEEEIGHVAIGNHWYQYCCDKRGVDSRQTFRSLIEQYFCGQLRGPFNWPARLAAGFEEDELIQLEDCL